jgi:hypothetical protein
MTGGSGATVGGEYFRGQQDTQEELKRRAAHAVEDVDAEVTLRRAQAGRVCLAVMGSDWA